MSLVALVMPSRDAAIALVRALGADPRYQRDGVPLPRCEHPRWWVRGGPLARLRRGLASGHRGLVPACPCTARDQPSVRCPHVTWQAASVLELPDGTALVQAEADAVAHRTEPRRALTDDEREALEEPWTLRGERDPGSRPSTVAREDVRDLRNDETTTGETLMAGRTIRICPPRTFTFDGLEGGTAAQKITIAERIDCSQYEIAELIVRVVGAVSTGVSPAKIEVILVSDGFTPDDPSQDFFSDDALATVSFSYLANGYPAGTLKIASAADLGSMLAVQVVGTPAATTGTLSGRLAIDLALKTN